MKIPLRVALAAVGAALATVGCRLPAESPTPRYWVLAPIEGTAAVATARVVGVGPFELPAYLDRREITSRSAGSELRVSAQDSWGEELKRGFPRTLARNLEILLPGTATVIFPWMGLRSVDHQVAGEVGSFEVVDGTRARLEVTWSVTRRSDGKWIGGGAWRGEVPVSGSGVAAEIAALSQVLGEFSRELARAVPEAG